MSADQAAEVLLAGGVIAYPTEGVFGLGCLPADTVALKRLLRIKKRDPAKGLILIAAGANQLEDWISLVPGLEIPDADPKHPVTWIVPASDTVNPYVRGENAGIAVRITTHPVARSICAQVGSPVVSTSANLSGQPVAATAAELRRQFETLVDYIVPGECGPSSGPSEIRVLASGEVLRPR
jgi:L-threonylcarbamoyladenylate synthase